MANVTGAVSVLILKPWRRWIPGDVAGFRAEIAQELVDHGIAEFNVKPKARAAKSTVKEDMEAAAARIKEKGDGGEAKATPKTRKTPAKKSSG